MNHYLRNILALLLGSIASQGLVAQSQDLPCGTSIMTEQAMQNHPEMQSIRQQLEAFTQSFDPNSSERAIKVVPVVFHIIHNYGPENIPREQVEDAVRILNEDYQLLNEDQNEVVSAFAGIIGNTQFEFRLARKDPNGNCTDGITRTVSTLTYEANDNVKDLISWPSNRYLNIWVADKVLAGGVRVGGYAYQPGNAPGSNNDGIIVDHRQLGSVGTSNGSNFAARTLTHEVGHWFNLDHTWGSSNQPGLASNCNIDDGVSDTPNTIGVADQSCNLTQNTCGTLDNVQNYMDYSNCAKMFTVGQSNRMIAAINSSAGNRNNLWSTSNLTFTGVNGDPVQCAPVADFYAQANTSCDNSSITLYDASYNAAVDGTWSWNWTISGGTPATSTEQNPSVSYPAPGTYPVSLTVTNAAGTDSQTKTGFITIGPSVASMATPYSEGFEQSGFPAINADPFQNWTINGQSNAFQRTTASFATGSASVRYVNSAVTEGSVSELISPYINLDNTISPVTLTFKVAYAQRTSATNDRLQVYASDNCGRTWVLRYNKMGSALSTTGGTTISGTFNPTASQWRTETVNLSPLIGDASGLIKFVVTDSSGNNIFLDDINITGTPAGLSPTAINEFLTFVQPNPGNGEAMVQVGMAQQGTLELEMMDLGGRVIGSRNFGRVAAGEHQFRIGDLAAVPPASGLYFIRIRSGNSMVTRKWVCE